MDDDVQSAVESLHEQPLRETLSALNENDPKKKLSTMAGIPFAHTRTLTPIRLKAQQPFLMTDSRHTDSWRGC